MPTDAPTHALCVVVEDVLVDTARYSLGMKAGSNFCDVVEGALIEAIRARSGALWNPDGKNAAPLKREDIRHHNRVRYWASEGRHAQLTFLIEGSLTSFSPSEWDNDTSEQHLSRLIGWCRARNYECISFSFTKSRLNVTPWHVEMVVVPELQPLYFNEKIPQASGSRISEVPRLCGHTPRSTPFLEEPHPFT